MKTILAAIALLLITGVGNTQDKEKRIKFNNGTLKICSNSHMTIKGYDGDEVIIKSLNQNRIAYDYNYDFEFSNKNRKKSISKDSIRTKMIKLIDFFDNDKELEEGLTPLGNKSTNPADNLYLDIMEKPGELIIKDYKYNTSNRGLLTGYSVRSKSDKKKKSGKKDKSESFVNLFSTNKYELLIPNSIKLSWNVEDCAKKNSNTFFIRTDSNPWELSDFKGDVEISTSYKSISLTNVSGPVIANTIGGNITVVFDNMTPTNLYSLVSNDGYINVTLPEKSSVNVDATGDRILSNISFTVLNETISDGVKDMHLKLNSGKTKMKLDAGSGNVYIRKPE